MSGRRLSVMAARAAEARLEREAQAASRLILHDRWRAQGRSADSTGHTASCDDVAQICLRERTGLGGGGLSLGSRTRHWALPW